MSIIRKKILLGVLLVVVIVGVYAVYSYLTPIISIRISRPLQEHTDNYAQEALLASSTKMGLPMPPKTEERLLEFYAANQSFILELHENYTTPMQINASVAISDGKTVLRYYGQATDKNGEYLPYEREQVFEYILTTDISNSDNENGG